MDSDKEIMESFEEEPVKQEAEAISAPQESPVESSEVQEARRTIKFKDGDSIIEIPADALYEDTTKDGQELKLKAEELVRSPWAQADIGRKYSEIDKEKKELENLKRFKQALTDKTDGLKGYDKMAALIQEMVAANPELSQDVRAFEEEYARQIADYLQASEAEREYKAREYRAKEIERENKQLKNLNQKELNHYAYNKASELSKKYEAFGITPSVIDQAASRLIQEGKLRPVSDKTSVDTALEAVGQMLESELGPKRDKTMADLNKAMDIVEKISPELLKNNDAVLDAYRLMIEKGLPEDAVIRKIKALHEDTLPDEPKNRLEQQRERVTGKKPLGKKQSAGVRDEDFIITDPEAAFRQGLY